MKGVGKKFTQNQNDLYSWINMDLPALQGCLKGILTSKSNVLDIGCGNGRMVKELSTFGVQESNIFGVDHDVDMIEDSRQEYPKAHFEVGDLRKWKSPRSNYYDLCIAIHVLHYFDQDELTDIFHVVSDSLLTSGHFVFLVVHPIRWTRNNLQKYFLRGFKTIPTPWDTKVKIHLSTLEDYTSTLAKVGFVMEQVQEPAPIPAGRKDVTNYTKYRNGPMRLLVVSCKD